MKNVTGWTSFKEEGGTELAPCSTTTNLSIAAEYAASKETLLFKVVVNTIAQRGADLSYLSCFPKESEILFPPLTYFAPRKGADGKVRCTKLALDDVAGKPVTVCVVEVEPHV